MMTISRKMVLGLVAAGLCLGGGFLVADDIAKHSDYTDHAPGWDSMNLKIEEKDSAGRATLERDSNSAHRMERKSTYRPNGKKASVTYSVTSKANGKTLYFGKKDWVENGDLESIYIRDDVYSAEGKPSKGWITEKHYQNGRLVMDVNKKYSDVTGDWTDLHKHSIKYYADGDMKERITENVHAGHVDETKETWDAEHTATGHKRRTQTDIKKSKATPPHKH